MNIYLNELKEANEKHLKPETVNHFAAMLSQCIESIDQTVARIAGAPDVDQGNELDMTQSEQLAILQKIRAISGQTTPSTITIPRAQTQTDVLNGNTTAKSAPPENSAINQQKAARDDEEEEEDETDQLEENHLISVVDLNPAFTKLRSIFAAVAQQQNVSLRFSANQLPPSITNEAMMQDVMANLVSNAIKFSGRVQNRSAWVVVHLLALKNEIRLKVVDNGIGIAKDMQQKIFDPYFQIEKAGSSSRGSDSQTHNIPTSEGLGLAMVKHSLEQLPDHRLMFKSNINQGATFTVYLPRA